MEIEIIDEKSENPFQYFLDEEGYYYFKEKGMKFPRSYENFENVKLVMKGILGKLNLQNKIECLEIGAGHNPLPSKSLSKLGQKVSTLDADWEPKRHTELSYEKLQELRKTIGNELLIPNLYGKNEDVSCYLGDIAFIKDEKSLLKNKGFDLIYFWGSIISNGICSSIQNSQNAKYKHHIEIEYKDRILKPISSINENGKLISVAGYFCGHTREELECIDNTNMEFIELGLHWAFSGNKIAKKIGFFIQSPDSVINQGITKLDDQAEIILHKNPLERMIEKQSSSLFGKTFNKNENYKELESLYSKLDINNVKKLENLGIIDAVYVSF